MAFNFTVRWFDFAALHNGNAAGPEDVANSVALEQSLIAALEHHQEGKTGVVLAQLLIEQRDDGPYLRIKGSFVTAEYAERIAAILEEWGNDIIARAS